MRASATRPRRRLPPPPTRRVPQSLSASSASETKGRTYAIILSGTQVAPHVRIEAFAAAHAKAVAPMEGALQIVAAASVAARKEWRGRAHSANLPPPHRVGQGAA